MIEELTIKNLGIIDTLSIELTSGLNVITGETGAGKSLLLKSIRFLFGDGPAPADLVRRGERCLEVAARCLVNRRSSPRLAAELAEKGVDVEDGVLTIKRVFEADSGRSRAFLQDMPAALSSLKRLGQAILEVHGQGESASLYDPSFAQAFLDHWGRYDKFLSAYAEAFDAWREALGELEQHRDFVGRNLPGLELIEHHLKELQEIDFDPKTLAALTDDLPLWVAKGEVAEQMAGLMDSLENPDADAVQALSRAALLAERLRSRLGERNDVVLLAERLAQAREAAGEALRFAEQIRHSLEFDPARLDELLGLKAKIDRLLAKHRLSRTEELSSLKIKFAQDRQRLANAAAEEARLAEEAARLERAARKEAEALSLQRSAAAKDLSQKATKEVRLLGLEQATIEFESVPVETLGSQGADHIVCHFSPNPGEGKKELRRIASGGESSRVALALKSLNMNKGRRAEVPWVLLLDEVEQGLSSQVAALVAQRLQSLAAEHQIIAVTHSPMLAGRAKTLFRVGKRTAGGRTTADLRRLEGAGDIKTEMMRLLGAVSAKERGVLEAYVNQLLELPQHIAS
ncbi:MAG: AAA family ATPase [Elusimicrobia bacterium]|nr:AAA family ATPase [Elusimicrobiota bacterium]